jgi:hypothetical protein
MSDSDCSNCCNQVCPYHNEDHYNCIIKKAESAKIILTQELHQELIQIKQKFGSLVYATDWIDGELSDLSRAADKVLQLLEIDTSHGGPVGC